MYVPPNEQHPAVALPICRLSNHEAYVSVGTERSFMGAAVTRAAVLVVVDYDPTVRFAEINRALLAGSHRREDYSALRFSVPAQVWQERNTDVGVEDAKTLSDEKASAFWKEKVRDNTTAWSGAFELFNKAAEKPGGAFAETNYLRQGSTPCGSRDGPKTALFFLSTERANRQSDTYWSYYAFTGKAVKRRDAETIQRWCEAEIKKLGADPETRALVDDPDVVNQVKLAVTRSPAGHV